MKVYIIQKGSYSDRHIITVVTDENKAKEICEAISNRSYRYDKAYYEEYETEQYITNLFRFIVSSWGEEWEADIDDYGTYEDFTESCPAPYDYNTYVIFAHNQDEAIKIAQDMKAEIAAKEAEISL